MTLSPAEVESLTVYFRKVWICLSSRHASKAAACYALASHPDKVIKGWNVGVEPADCALLLAKRIPRSTSGSEML